MHKNIMTIIMEMVENRHGINFMIIQPKRITENILAQLFKTGPEQIYHSLQNITRMLPKLLGNTYGF